MFITTGGGGGPMTASTPDQSPSRVFCTPKSADERGKRAETNHTDEGIIII